MCAMGPPSSGNTVTPRFSRHFNQIVINEFSDDIMVAIFTKIMLWHLDTRYVSQLKLADKYGIENFDLSSFDNTTVLDSIFLDLLIDLFKSLQMVRL